jgi:hypothetical protein
MDESTREATTKQLLGQLDEWQEWYPYAAVGLYTDEDLSEARASAERWELPPLDDPRAEVIRRGVIQGWFQVKASAADQNLPLPDFLNEDVLEVLRRYRLSSYWIDSVLIDPIEQAERGFAKIEDILGRNLQ